MNQDNRRFASVAQRLRDALVPVHRVAVVGATTTSLPKAVQSLGAPEGTLGGTPEVQEQLADLQGKDSAEGAFPTTRPLSSAPPPSSATTGSPTSNRKSVASYIAGHFTSRFRFGGKRPLPHLPSSSVATETAYKFYEEPSLREPLVLFGDDSAG